MEDIEEQDEVAANLILPEDLEGEDYDRIEYGEEILDEAGYVLGLFTDPNETHWNAEDLRGENGESQQRWARAEVRKLVAFIKKYRTPVTQ